MARTVNEIYTSLLDFKSQVGLPQNNSPMSMVNRLIYVFSLGINQYELLLDSFKEEVEDLSNTSSYGSRNWIRQKALEFQFSNTSPQVVQFDPITFKTSYPTVNEELRIIKGCSVRLTPNRFTLVKVAKGTPGAFVPLSTQELSSINSYFDFISPTGQNTNVISIEGDDLELDITVYYNSQAPIGNLNLLITNAIRNYCYGIEFDGTVVVNKIIDAMQDVENVENAIVTRAYSDNVDNRGNGTTFTVEQDLLSGYVRNITFNISSIPR